MSQQLYKPAEACKIAEVAPYVLRYWETEFPVLSEGKEKSGPRTYTEHDVKIIARIRELLYDEGFTVAGAKKRLEAEIAQGRFEDNLKSAPPPAEQRSARSARPTATAATPKVPAPVAVPIAPVPDLSESMFLTEPEAARPSASANASGSSSFPDRGHVIRELKEIVQLLERGRSK